MRVGTSHAGNCGHSSHALTHSIPLSGALSDLAYFRKQNPSARLLASLGGEAVGPAVFGGLLQPEGSLANLTSSVNALYREGVIDGVEIDWEWPAGSGDKEDREKLVKYARVRDIGRRQLYIRERNEVNNGSETVPTSQVACQRAGSGLCWCSI